MTRRPPGRSRERAHRGRLRPPRHGGDRGQATVEFALALPLVVIVMLALAQLGLTMRNEIVVELAAREGARAASVAADPTAAAAAAVADAVDLPIDVRTSTTARTVTVTVSFTDPTDIPLIGHALGAVTHRASATMQLEPP